MNVRHFAAAAVFGMAVSTSLTRADFMKIEPIQVGSGLMSSFVQLEFFEGQTYLFQVFYSDFNTNGFDLLVALDVELGDGFTLDYLGSPESAFITGLGFDGHFDHGDGSGGNDWWRYWIRNDAASLWMTAGTGPSARLVSDGSWDGWIFGRDDDPVAVKIVPAPPATLALAGLLIVGPRRRRTC